MPRKPSLPARPPVKESDLIADIRQGLAEVRAGKGVPHDRVMRDIERRITRAARRKRPQR
jgi:predicted transcriptional regulator